MLAPASPALSPPSAVVLKPQPGFQTKFLSSHADITIGGGSAGCGKRLDVDTPIATPTGWTTMGALAPGDMVFDGDGVPTVVTWASPIEVAPESYVVRFSDGSEIVADAEHLWLTLSYRERTQRMRLTDERRAARRASRPRRGKGISPRTVLMNEQRRWEHKAAPVGSVRTTSEIGASILHAGRINHAIPVAGPLELEEVELPIDPYVLGVWLGDGHSHTGVITGDDARVFEEIEAAGFAVARIPSQARSYRADGLTDRLRAIGLLGKRSEAKKIPPSYLRASAAQRLALLQGLMDTDGSCAADTGRCEFTTTKPALRNGVLELLASLGVKASAAEGVARLNGRDIGPKWRIGFFAKQPAFRIPLKLVRQKRSNWRGEMAFQRYVVSVTRTAPVPMRCISVAAESHLYLAGRSMIPTHNSFAEMLAAARHKGVKGFSAVFFRRTTTDIRNPGALWDESYKVFPLLGAKPRNDTLEWTWPSGAKVKMAHLEHDSTVLDWHGAQVPLFIFDELTSFTAKQFWYMLSRNRSTCGVRPYIIATTNPDADSWVADLIAWWIDQDEHLADGGKNPRYGFPIEERAGKLRYFTRLGDEMVWGDSRKEVLEHPDVRKGVEEAMREAEMSYEDAVTSLIKSITFDPGKLKENKILERANPGYRGNLMAMTRVERARLLDGNWKARAVSGEVFKREEVTILDDVPNDVVQWVRSWDLAATEPTETNQNPDWTIGVKMGRRKSGRIVIADMRAERRRTDEVRQMIVGTAKIDGVETKIRLPQDPGQAGVDQKASYVKLLAGFDVDFERETGSKQTRADPFAAQWQHGNVDVVRGKWNLLYFSQMEAFPSTTKKIDAVDASSGGFRQLDIGPSMWDVL